MRVGRPDEPAESDTRWWFNVPERLHYLRAALDYQVCGFVPIPVAAGSKHPPKGFDLDALFDRLERGERLSTEEIKSWWARWPDAQIGLITGAATGLIVLDVDGEDVELPGGVPLTPAVKTSKGFHYYFAWNGPKLPALIKIADRIEVRGDRGYVVAPPSVHSSGALYSWLISPEEADLAELPEWLRQAILERVQPPSRDVPKELPAEIPEGQRNVALTSLAGTLRRRGLTAEEIEAALLAFNASRCRPPLPEPEVRRIAQSVARYEPADPLIVPSSVRVSWEEVEKTFGKWLRLESSDPVRVVLATVVANRLPGDPVWLFLVAPPSSAKTEILLSLSGLEDVYTLSLLTPNTFLSGKESKDGDCSLLPQLNGKILVMKDFAPILSMHREARDAIFAQLRDIYDGRMERAVGNERKTIRWSGKIGFIAGITQALDTYSSFFSVLGERFLQYRLPELDEDEVTLRAIENVGRETAMRKELREVVTGFFEGLPWPEAMPNFEIPELIVKKLTALVRLVIRARTGVIRDSYGRREIVYVPDHEGPARLTKQLALLMMGLAWLRGSLRIELEDYRLAHEVALGSIHKIRRRILELLAEEDWLSTTDVATRLDLSKDTARRYLEDLNAVGVLQRRKAGDYDTAPDEWTLKPEVREWEEVARP